MRTVAAAGAVATAMLIQSASPGSVHVVAQADLRRGALEPASASVSADGRYVAFTSYARLNVADVDDRRDVYVLDRVNGRVSLESSSPDPNDETENRHPNLSADGHVIVYERVFPSRSEIVRRDRVRGAATVITRGVQGENVAGFISTPDISQDARFVVFSSNATNLVAAADGHSDGEEVYLYNHPSGAIERLSVREGGRQASPGFSVTPSVSADGRYVAFASTADLSGPTPAARRLPWYEVFVLDRANKSTRLVSQGLKGEPANGGSWSPSLSADGRFVAFVSSARNLVADDRNNAWDVFVADLTTGQIELVSRTPAGSAANGRSVAPVISDGGQVVAFQSEASDMLCDRRCTLAGEDINLLWDVFVADRRGGTIRRVSRDASKEWMEPSYGPAIDGSGTVIVFSSRHPIDASDLKNDFDLFICAPRLAAR
jgi:Tol biopolymer transport system component